MRTPLVVALLALSTPLRALAERGPDLEVHVVSRRDPRANTDAYLVLPAGTATVTPRLRFLTAGPGLFGPRELELTDIALLDLSGRVSLGGKAELAASGTFLPKQPSFSRERIWQGAALGARAGAGKLALSIGGEVGPLLARPGLWTAATGLLEARHDIHPTFSFHLALGGATTGLLPRESASLWYGEAVAQAELVWSWPRAAALWIGADFRFPVTGAPSPELTPATRANLRLGGALTYVDDWDLFAELQVVDRGDAAEPSTHLPVLDGGFDQRVLTLGVTRRFGRE